MQTPFRYSFTTHTGKWYGIVNGTVRDDLTTVQFFYLDAVANWDDLVKMDIRNWRMSGFNRKGVEEIVFVKDAAKIVRHIFYNRGETEKASVYIDKYNYSTMQYESYIGGYLYFDGTVDERDYINARVAQSGIEELIKANEDVKYEIPLVANTKNVLMQPLRLSGKIRYLTTKTGGAGNIAGSTYTWTDINQYEEQFLEVVDSDNLRPFFVRDRVVGGVSLKGQESTSSLSFTGSSGQINYLFRADVPLYNVRIKADIPIFIKNNDVSNSTTIRFRIYAYDFNTTTLNPIEEVVIDTLTASGAAGDQGNYTASMDHTFDIGAANGVFLMFTSSNGAQWEIGWENEKRVSVDFEYYATEYTVTGLNAYELCRQLIGKVTNNTATFQSDLLSTAISYAQGIDCRPDRLLITSGAAIKGLTNPTIKVSLRDLLNSLDVMLCCGLGVEGNTVRIEKRSYFFKETTGGTDNLIANLTNIEGTPTVERDETLRISSLKIGYPPMDEEDLNSYDNYNTTVWYTTGTEGEDVELISRISASPYEMQRVRVRHDNDEGANTGGNDKLFVVQYAANPTSGNTYDAFYPSQVGGTPLISGITEPTYVANLGLSPARCLIRRAYWLLGHFWSDKIHPTSGLTQEDTLIFQNAEALSNRTQAIVTKLTTSYQINETANRVLSQFGTRLFYPYRVTVNTTSPANYDTAWTNNRNGIFSYYDEQRQTTVKFFPLESEESGIRKTVKNYKGLLSAGNNLANLIR